MSMAIAVLEIVRHLSLIRDRAQRSHAPQQRVKGGSSSLGHQDLREGSTSEALLFDDFELQVLI